MCDAALIWCVRELTRQIRQCIQTRRLERGSDRVATTVPENQHAASTWFTQSSLRWHHAPRSDAGGRTVAVWRTELVENLSGFRGNGNRSRTREIRDHVQPAGRTIAYRHVRYEAAGTCRDPRRVFADPDIGSRTDDLRTSAAALAVDASRDADSHVQSHVQLARSAAIHDGLYGWQPGGSGDAHRSA